MKRALLVGVLLLGTVAAGSAYLLRRGYSAREPPSALEAAVARRLRGLATPARAQRLANPVPATPEVMGEALAHFADHCAVCHANDGSGETAIGQGLYPRSPDMRAADTQRLSDGELFYIIRNGVRFTGMPGWGSGPEHEDRDSWGLVHFIRHLPRLTPAELAEMQRLNPKGPRQLEEEREAEAFLRGEDVP
ncbi:MAG TPA: c-type cytochrome, partial [Vicinamibacteria bacterium]|nr:c-type cytochrome [Vicinamibacteria bacterium]